MKFGEFCELYMDNIRVEVKRPRRRGSFNVDYGFLADYENAQARRENATCRQQQPRHKDLRIVQRLGIMSNMEVIEIDKYSVTLDGQKTR